MKKILLILCCIALLQHGFAQNIDTSDAGKLVLYQLYNRPPNLSEKQAIDLITHPGKIDTVSTDTVLAAKSFAALPFLNKTWHYDIYRVSIYSKNGTWVKHAAATIYKPYEMESSSFISVILIGLLFFIFLGIWGDTRNIKHAVLDGKTDLKKIHSVVRKYRLQSSIVSLLKTEILWPLVIGGCVICLLFGGNHPICKSTNLSIISIAWWFVLLSLLLCILRIWFTRRTIRYLREDHAIEA